MGIGAYASAPRFEMEKHDDSSDGGRHHHSTHYELRGISSLQVTCPVLTTHHLQKLDEWIRTVLWENHLPEAQASELQVLRCKGLFSTETGQQLVLQGVRNMYEICDANSEVVGIPDEGKVVLIGKGLNDHVRCSLEGVFK